jgi:hypothetical protein
MALGSENTFSHFSHFHYLRNHCSEIYLGMGENRHDENPTEKGVCMLHTSVDKPVIARGLVVKRLDRHSIEKI